VTRWTAHALTELARTGAAPLWVVGNSCAIRDVDLWGDAASAVPVLTQRGVAGIDGIVSGAVGSAVTQSVKFHASATRPFAAICTENAEERPRKAPKDNYSTSCSDRLESWA
jgi:hypothetical protein